MNLRNKALLAVMLVLTLFTCVLPYQAFAAATGTHTPVAGVTASISGASDNSMSNGVVTVTAKGSSGFLGIGASAKTATITISQDSGRTATLSFDWTATSVNQLVIDGTTYTGTSGSFSKLLDSGASFTVTITTAKNSTINTLKLSNFALTTAAAESNVTILFDSGSVTVDGTGVSNNSVNEIPITGATIAATPTDFVGWIDAATNQILSTSASFTLIPAADMTIKAIHGPDARFFVGNFSTAGYLFEKLPAATAYASTAGTKTVVLANNGTLPAGDYTIPNGVTLLIPRDSANSLHTTQPNIIEPTNFGDTPPAVTSFRKLTMATGANITVNGAISIAGTQWAGGLYASCTTGAAGFIHMNSESSITVNSGGFLYAWGYITGTGSVTAKSGATVYESFQVSGWRGGDMTSNMAGGDNKDTYGVFPMSQYYVQNIEVPLKLESGAKENTLLAVNVSIIGIQKISVAFVGTEDTMFKITNGYVIKDYVESEDRLNLELHGDVTLTPIEISMKLGIFGSVTFQSQYYELPLNSNMTIHGVSGNMTVGQDIAMLPGTEIIIDEGVTCTLGSGVSIYAYDADQWGDYCGSTNVPFMLLPNAPGRSYTRTAADLVDASVCVNGTIEASNGYLYTTESGANIYSTGSGVVKVAVGTQENTYQVIQAGEPTDSTYKEIPITPAQLKNSDGSYISTEAIANGGYGEGTYTYYADTGLWCPPGHLYGEGIVTGPTCTEAGYTLHTCAACGDSYVDGQTKATGHSWGAWEVTTAATFSAPGEQRRTCSQCDASETQEIPQKVAVAVVPVSDTQGYYCETLTEALIYAAKNKYGKIVLNANITEPVVVEQRVAIYKNGHTAANLSAAADYVMTDRADAWVFAPEVESIQFDVIQLSVEGEVILRLKFYIPQSILAEDTVTVTWTEEENTIEAAKTNTLTMAELKAQGVDDEGRYILEQGIASGEMTGEVTVKFLKADGTAIPIYEDGTAPAVFTKTVVDFARQSITKGSEKMKNLSRAMVIFGGYAQAYFNTDAENPAYDVLTELAETIPSIEKYATHGNYDNQVMSTGKAEIGIAKVSQKLILDSKIGLVTYFTPSEGTSLENCTFTLTYTEGGKGKTKVLEATEVSGRYRIDIENIPVAYWDYMYKITISDSEGHIYELSSSVLAWARRCIESTSAGIEAQKNVAKTMFFYNYAANEYFGK